MRRFGRAAVRRWVVMGAGVGGVLLAGAPAASAHPLGNFSVNQYHELVVHADRVTDSAVLDIAEIPTLQAEPEVDTNHDGVREPSELAAYAARTCGDVERSISAEVDGHSLSWQVAGSAMEYRPGAAGLSTSRFTCSFSAAASGSTLTFHTGYLTDRVGWREITARGDGVAVTADVPEHSTSDKLRTYPRDLLADPLNVTSARVREGASGAAAAGAGAGPASGGWATSLERSVASWDRSLATVAEARRLTVPVGLAAVLLAMLLGAAHAALPGHGKTLMAACLAGRRGGVRDAAVVAGSVTLAHTGGVLGMGLLLTASVHFAADRLMQWLTVISGLMVVGAGVVMLRGVRRRSGHHHTHAPHTHADGHVHTHAGDHVHSHGHHSHDGHAHAVPRATLISMATAGGLVPSPTALVVLLGTVALGRTAFGVGLVVAYGLGMAATLVAAGFLAAGAGRRLRIPAPLTRLRAWTPALTASFVVLVGVGLTLRASAGLV